MRMEKQLIMYFLVATFIATPEFVSAATPLLTDDPATLGTGKGQLEICGRVGFDRDRTAGVTTKSTLSQITSTLTLGVAEPVDLGIEFARAWGTSTTAGVDSSEPNTADFKVSAKINLSEWAGLNFAIRPDLGYTYSPPGTSHDYSTFWGGTLIVGKNLDPLTVNLNIGYLHYNYQSEADRTESRPDIWSGSVSVTWQATPSMQFVSDIGTSTNPDKSSSDLPVFACGGIIYNVTDFLDLAGGFKVGLSNPETDIMLQTALILKF